ncbi:hypothetical protein TWF694_001971 [Orbilia ellipsospora]|uniref:LysM domain-containing protein n=1 Tax=Orbilia ellipsospora TaxID=2528407 RepID=A0AAV9X486_9PEZI
MKTLSLKLAVTALLASLVSSMPASLLARTSTGTKPAQTLPDEAPTCDYWYIALATGDTCFTIAERTGLSLVDLFDWNPSLESDCFGVKGGYGYCIDAPPASNTTSTSTSPSPTSSTTSSGAGTVTTTVTTTKTVSTTVSLSFTSTIVVTDGGGSAITVTSTVTSTAAAVTVTVTGACVSTTSSTTAPLSSTTTTTFSSFTSSSKTSSTTSSTTTTTTTKTTTTSTTTTSLPVPTFSPSQFPPTSAKSVLCATQPAGSGVPVSVPTGAALSQAITTACANILPGGTYFLEKGLPYSSSITVSGKTVMFYLTIWLGGFSVPNSLCVSQLMQVLNGCLNSGAGTTYGGCSSSSDLNFQTCFFPS